MVSAGEASALEVTVKRGDVSEEAAVKAFAKDIAKGHWLGAASQKSGLSMRKVYPPVMKHGWKMDHRNS